MDGREGGGESEGPRADHGAVQVTVTNGAQDLLIITGTLRSQRTSGRCLHLTR